jgi:cathepsin D
MDTIDVKDKSFAIYLAANPKESYMTIPGYDEELMKGRQFRYHDVVEKKYYSVNLSSVGRRDSRIDTKGYKAVIDSGTSAIIGPADMISSFVEGISVHSDCGNLSELPELIFTFDDVEYVLQPEDYVIKVSAFGMTQCVIGIMPA